MYFPVLYKKSRKIIVCVLLFIFIILNFAIYHFKIINKLSIYFSDDLYSDNSIISGNDISGSFTESDQNVSASCLPSYAIYAGDSFSPDLSIYSFNSQTNISYESSSTEVAVIDENGVITGIAPGTSTIFIKASSENLASFDIVVKKKMPDPSLDYPDCYDDKPAVVNIWNPLSEDYIPEVVRTREVVPSKASDLSLDAEALAHYAMMFEDCKKETGQEIILITGYRSYATQRYIHNNSIQRYLSKGYDEKRATELAGRSVQPPGNSEHQLGLAIDIGIGHSISSTFNKTKAGAWVTSHAHEYGWILRYPSDKKAITGISYEPWHFRYVGVEHATYIYSHNLCLEEYVTLQDEAAQNALEYSAIHPASLD